MNLEMLMIEVFVLLTLVAAAGLVSRATVKIWRLRQFDDVWIAKLFRRGVGLVVALSVLAALAVGAIVHEICWAPEQRPFLRGMAVVGALLAALLCSRDAFDAWRARNGDTDTIPTAVFQALGALGLGACAAYWSVGLWRML
jgi:hypothetical protein